MLKTPWMPVLSTVAAALLLSSCAADPAVDEAAADQAVVDDGGALDPPDSEGQLDSSDSVDADYLEWEASEADDAFADDIYAPPLPPAEDSPPSYAYDEVPTPESPFDHEPVAAAFEQAQAQGAEPDETGLLEFDEALGELEINGDTFTIDGVIDPGAATPLYEDEHREGDVSLTPLVEELTNISWPERREETLRAQDAEAACDSGAQHLWQSFDTAEDATCFTESGGVVDPYFRSISAICHSSEAEQARTLYMGMGGSHSSPTGYGSRTGWDLMHRSPQISEAGSCYAFTVPVRGAVASFSNAPG